MAAAAFLVQLQADKSVKESIEVSTEAPKMKPALVDGTNRCKYKTGKCENARSSKRNGQLHQLCLFHREKANRIQRKFDRQKRMLSRTKQMGQMPKDVFPINHPSYSRSFSLPNTVTAASHDRSSMCSVFSEPDFGHKSLLDDLMACEADMQPHVVNITEPSPIAEERLSVDEIDFLCSAMLN